MAGSVSSSAALPSTCSVGVVGAGAMGAGIAQVAAAAGHTVLLFDTRADAAGGAIAGVLAALSKVVAKGRMTEETRVALGCRLHAVDTLPALADCGLVVEAIVERLDTKQALFRELEKVVHAEALLATNTSSISITALGSALERPERLAGLHFFNPAPLMLLVEVISGAATSRATAETLHATATAWRKVPVYARSTPGFIVNRVARPFYAEALRVLNEGGANPQTLDAVLREAGGFRMGPFELMDLIGHDVNYAVTLSVFDAFYGDPRFTPSLLQQELVEAGFLGRKTGRGFFRYGDVELPDPDEIAAGPKPSRVCLYGVSAAAQTLRERLQGSGIEVTCDASGDDAHGDGRLAAVEGCVVYLSDGRTATARAVANGEANTILLDHALDYASATRVALTAAEQAVPQALADAAALFAAGGYAVSPLADVPGMAVLRTVAMLANEAADAVHQGVCNAADCDLAMRKGVNYPRGPLAWADALGLPFVVTVLENIGEAYGEDRYRVSPLLRRKAEAGTRFFSAEESA